MSECHFSAFAAGLGSRVARLHPPAAGHSGRAPAGRHRRRPASRPPQHRHRRAAAEAGLRHQVRPAVAIVVNSPGGSPVQSRLIAKRIRDLADEHDKPVLVFVEDVAASGGYFIATAGDEIIADPVLDRRLDRRHLRRLRLCRGASPSSASSGASTPPAATSRRSIRSCPKSPRTSSASRRSRPTSTRSSSTTSRRGAATGSRAHDDELFTGEWWTASRGLELGLVDALGDIHEVLDRPFRQERPPEAASAPGVRSSICRASAWRLAPPASGPGADLVAALEDRLVWSRFGL